MNNENLNQNKQTETKTYQYVYGVSFKKALQTYFFGYDDASINVVDVTLAERNFCTNIPEGWYVIEQTHMDGIVIWQDEQGCIYKAISGKIDKIHNSLKEYVAME